MVHYIKPDWLEDICRPDCPNNLAPLLVEVLATVLDNEVIFKVYLFSIFLTITTTIAFFIINVCRLNSTKFLKKIYC